MWAVLGWVITAPLVAVVALRFAWHDGAWPLIVANMFAPYVLAPVWLVAVPAALRRSWALAVTAGAVALYHLTLLAPAAVPRAPAEVRGETLRVVSANLLMVHPDTDALAAELVRADADVLLLQEVSPRWVAALERHGLRASHPHGVVHAREDSFGTAILSRRPLLDVGLFPLGGLPQSRAVNALDGAPVELRNVHTLPPRRADYVAPHRGALDAIVAWARAQGDSPFVIAGDFNATSRSRFAADIADIAGDAWTQAGRGFGHTFPNGVFPLPPVRIDHVYLSRQLTATTIAVGEGHGSDHRPLVVELGFVSRPRAR